jgi:ferredoxin/bacterioferritin-associated ferredoxin
VKTVTLRARIDSAKCTGCRTCAKVCPVLAISIEDKKAVVNPDKCRACANCQQHCPVEAVTLVRLEKPFVVQVELKEKDKERIDALCAKAGFNPSQIVCYCTATRADEVAQAIIDGADSPELISLRTGLRMGCSVECIQPALRLLAAASITPTPPVGGWQWYGKTPTLAEIPAHIKEKYGKRGFYFEDDLALFAEIARSPRR